MDRREIRLEISNIHLNCYLLKYLIFFQKALKVPAGCRASFKLMAILEDEGQGGRKHSNKAKKVLNLCSV